MRFLLLSIYIVTYSFSLTTCTRGEVKKIELDILIHADINHIHEMSAFGEIVRTFETWYDVILHITYAFGYEYEQVLLERAVNGNFPDIAMIWSDERSNYLIEQGLLSNLSSIYEGKLNNFYDIALLSKEDYIYMVPSTISVASVLFVNTRLLSQLDFSHAKTYADLSEQAQIIQEYNGKALIGMDNFDETVVLNFFSLLLNRFVEKEWILEAINGSTSFQNKQFLETLNFFKNMFNQNIISLNYDVSNERDKWKAFIEGRYPYFIEDIQNLSALSFLDDNANIDIMHFPTIPNQVGTTKSIPVVPQMGLAMNSGLRFKKKQMAEEWIWFFTGPEGTSIRTKNNIFNSSYINFNFKKRTNSGIERKLAHYLQISNAGFTLESLINNKKILALLKSLLMDFLSDKITAYDVSIGFDRILFQY